MNCQGCAMEWSRNNLRYYPDYLAGVTDEKQQWTAVAITCLRAENWTLGLSNRKEEQPSAPAVTHDIDRQPNPFTIQSRELITFAFPEHTHLQARSMMGWGCEERVKAETAVMWYIPFLLPSVSTVVPKATVKCMYSRRTWIQGQWQQRRICRKPSSGKWRRVASVRTDRRASYDS
jgi:hypothetical protein